jgi:hypothetical protein
MTVKIAIQMKTDWGVSTRRRYGMGMPPRESEATVGL